MAGNGCSDPARSGNAWGAAAGLAPPPCLPGTLRASQHRAGRKHHHDSSVTRRPPRAQGDTVQCEAQGTPSSQEGASAPGSPAGQANGGPPGPDHRTCLHTLALSSFAHVLVTTFRRGGLVATPTTRGARWPLGGHSGVRTAGRCNQPLYNSQKRSGKPEDFQSWGAPWW